MYPTSACPTKTLGLDFQSTADLKPLATAARIRPDENTIPLDQVSRRLTKSRPSRQAPPRTKTCALLLLPLMQVAKAGVPCMLLLFSASGNV